MSTSFILASLAQEGAQHAFRDAFSNGTVHNSTTPNDDTDINSVSSLILGFLPMVSLGLGFVGSFLLDYVLFQLVCTLAMVETPIPGGVASEKYALLDCEQAASKRSDERTASSTKRYYVTSGIRSTMRHVQAEAGDLSMFRGMGADLSLLAIASVANLIFEAAVYYPAKILHAGRFTWTVTTPLTYIIMAQAGAAWDHIMISKPRNKFWFRRLPLTLFTMIRILWIPIMAKVLVDHAIELGPQAYRYFRPLPQKSRSGIANITIGDGPVVNLSLIAILWVVLKVFLRSLVAPTIRVFLRVPFETVITRMTASVLPDEDDPIVPMDRSFSGGPSSGLLHQQQPLDFASGWRSIDKATYYRLVKLNLKCRLIKEVLSFGFWFVLVGQIAALVGPSAIWVVIKIIFGVPIVHHDLDEVSNGAREILYKVITNGTVTMSNMTVGISNATLIDGI